eukprot:scaffold403801_cov79-Attheya_sp.AAC.1
MGTHSQWIHGRVSFGLKCKYVAARFVFLCRVTSATAAGNHDRKGYCNVKVQYLMDPLAWKDVLVAGSEPSVSVGVFPAAFAP